MPNFYTITCGTEQAIITDKLKSSGAEVIQSSSGLVAKSSLSLTEVEALVGSASCHIAILNRSDDHSPDIQKFVSES